MPETRGQGSPEQVGSHRQGGPRAMGKDQDELCNGLGWSLTFSHVCTSHLRISLQCRYGFSGFGEGPEILHS